MPTYLCRGFRWYRRSIRVYVVVQNLDDAAPEWIVKRGSAQSLIESFYNLFDFLPDCTHPPTRPASSAQQPSSESSDISRKRSKSEAARIPSPPSTHAPGVYQTHNAPLSSPSSPSSHPRLSYLGHGSQGNGLDPVLTQHWSPIRLLEEYDPNNLEEVSRPYAYVADYVQRIDASCSIVEEIAKYEHHGSGHLLNGKRGKAKLERGSGWFEQLRDQLQRGEEVKWYVVVNGDEERAWPVDGTARQPNTGAQKVHSNPTQCPRRQSISGDQQNGDVETRRQQLRRELGYEEDGINTLQETKPDRNPEVPEKELLPSSTGSQMQPAGASGPKSPKMPVRAFRRLFRRSKTGDETP